MLDVNKVKRIYHTENYWCEIKSQMTRNRGLLRLGTCYYGISRN